VQQRASRRHALALLVQKYQYREEEYKSTNTASTLKGTVELSPVFQEEVEERDSL
jgi:hypothetical protein